MADHGSIAIFDFNPNTFQVSNLAIQTSLDSAVHHAGVHFIFDDPVRESDMMRVGQFGIAGTGADVSTNTNAGATTGQLYPYVIAPGTSDS